jgi:cytochrome c-type biogenesis protein CcmH/NrfF
MAWQLWVMLVVVAIVLVTVVVMKFRRASRVFNRIIAQVDEDRTDR